MCQHQRDLLASTAVEVRPFVARPDQEDVLSNLRTVWASMPRGERKIVVKCPTGWGKTVALVLLVWRIRQQNPRARVVIVIGRIDLAGQTLKQLLRHGFSPDDISIMRGDDPRYREHAPIQIVSHQTVRARAKKGGAWPPADFIVVDECHERSQTVFDHMVSEEGSRATWFGMSATPWAKGLGKYWRAMVKGPSLGELVKIGLLAPWIIYAPPAVRFDVEGVKIDPKNGDYKVGELAERGSRPQLVADIVSKWLELGERRPTIVFAVNKAHAKLLARQFNEVGIPAGYVDDGTEADDREAIGKQLQRGELNVVVNIQTLTTGLDWPFVSCIVLARPTKSEMLYVQMMGRGLRTSPETGKVDCIIIDHSTTSRDLGCLKEIDREALDDGEEGAGEAKRKEQEKAPPKLQECKTCPTLSPAHVAECISCGTPFPVRRVVDVVDGELEVLSGSGGVSRGKAEPVLELLRKLGRERVGAMLNFMKATRKGNRDSWARHRMGDIFGVRPRHETMSSFGFERPCPELESWVRSRDIAWSRSHGRYSVGAGAGYAN